MPSRHSSRTSRRSTKTTSPRPLQPAGVPQVDEGHLVAAEPPLGLLRSDRRDAGLRLVHHLLVSLARRLHGCRLLDQTSRFSFRTASLAARAAGVPPNTIRP